MRCGRPWYLLLALLVATVCLPVGRARAKKFKYKVAKFVESKGVIYMDVKFPELFTKKLRKKLKSGFVQTIVLRVTVREAITRRRLTRTVWTCTAAYDLWEDRYLVRVADPRKKKTFREKTRKKAIVRATTVDRLPLVKASKVAPYKYYFVSMRVLFNPVSKSLLRKVRQWLREPRGGPDRILRGPSVFGSRLSFFINPRISPAERQMKLRTQSFYRTEK
jgi:hypothetical protein